MAIWFVAGGGHELGYCHLPLCAGEWQKSSAETGPRSTQLFLITTFHYDLHCECPHCDSAAAAAAAAAALSYQQLTLLLGSSAQKPLARGAAE